VSAFPVKGKVALITGAAHGIGNALAQALHARGASVVLADWDADEVKRAAAALGSERALGLELDVRYREANEAAMARALERFGGLDLLVANAGIAGGARPMLNTTPEDFQRVIDVNLIGVANSVHAALEPIVERKGHILVIASVYAFTNGALQVPYAMAKAGVEQLGRGLRAELSIHGATAGVGYFGFIDTHMVQGALVDPIVEGLMETVPRPLRAKRSPAQAAEALVKGIEKRAARTIYPRRWTALSVLRGIVGPPLDAAMVKQDTFVDALRQAETAPQLAHTTSELVGGKSTE
jgi:NAD(P)-dependent dehydrogenase (short-subunit alcohol dehydrogenase family)